MPPRETLSANKTLLKALCFFAVTVGLLVAFYFIPLPSLTYLRTWAESLGSWFPWVFFAAYAVITSAPIPRSTFTISSGILFAPAIGLTGAMIATMIAAAFSFVLVRKLGRQRVQKYLTHPFAQAIEARMSARGWLAVGSLRLIAACPFSVTNYCAGLSSIKFLPYFLSTLLCVAPGTVSVVLLGNAVTGAKNPWLFALTIGFLLIGIAGLIIDYRLHPTHFSNLAIESSDEID